MANSRIVAGIVLGLAVNSAIAARDLGVDVSHFQGSAGVPQSNWNAIAAGGDDFTYIKATEGLTGPDDATMATNVARAGAAGLLTGVYHVPHPENRPTPAGAVQEADHLLSYAGAAIGVGHLRPVLDLESNAAALSTSALTDWVLAFVNEVVAKDGPAATPIIYANASFANSELDSRVSSLDLWIADPSSSVSPLTGQPPATGPFSNPLGQFSNWVFWQYNESGSAGGIAPIDLDVEHSEYKTLQSLVIPEPGCLGMVGLGVVGMVRRRRSCFSKRSGYWRAE